MRSRPSPAFAFVVLLALCTASLLSLSAQDKQEVLNDDSVIQMVKAGLTPEVTINAVNSQPGNYALGATSLTRLKQAGVPDKVIAAMQAKAGAAPSPTTSRPSSASEPPASKSGVGSGRWKVDDTADSMTGARRLQAVMTEDVEANGRHGDMQVTATCAPGTLQFDLVYASKFDQKTGFKQADTFLGSRVYMPVRLDDRPVHPTGSGSDHRNEGFVRFADPSGDPVSSLENIVAVGTPAQAFQANVIKVQVTLSNGDEPILEMHPQDPEFKSFASRCPTPVATATPKPAPPSNPSPLRGVLPASVTQPAVAHRPPPRYPSIDSPPICLVYSIANSRPKVSIPLSTIKTCRPQFRSWERARKSRPQLRQTSTGQGDSCRLHTKTAISRQIFPVRPATRMETTT